MGGSLGSGAATGTFAAGGWLGVVDGDGEGVSAGGAVLAEGDGDWVSGAVNRSAADARVSAEAFVVGASFA